eukprot:5518411-Prymnesium_polylepis.1
MGAHLGRVGPQRPRPARRRQGHPRPHQVGPARDLPRLGDRLPSRFRSGRDAHGRRLRRRGRVARCLARALSAEAPPARR